MARHDFHLPTEIRFGPGRRAEVGEVIVNFGNRCLLVTGPSASLTAVSGEISRFLGDRGVAPVVFNRLVANPTREGVEDGLRTGRDAGVDCVLAVGGGSVIDTAKVISLFFSGTEKIDWEMAFSLYVDPFRMVPPAAPGCLPLVAMPTTSGSGSHVTQAAVVTDAVVKEKRTLFHPTCFPRVSIIDPELMLSLPGPVTAATGFDAFSHAFESFLGNRISPPTDQMAMEAMRLILENLPLALGNPTDLQARENLAWADTLAGICLANGGASIPHPLGEIIGGVCPQIAHGETLAMVYPEFMQARMIRSSAKFAKAARTLRGDCRCLTDGEAARVFCTDIERFLDQVGLGLSLNDRRIGPSEFQDISATPLFERMDPSDAEECQDILQNSRQRSAHEIS